MTGELHECLSTVSLVVLLGSSVSHRGSGLHSLQSADGATKHSECESQRIHLISILVIKQLNMAVGAEQLSEVFQGGQSIILKALSHF